MKKQLIILAVLLIVNSLSAQNVGINTMGNAPNASAALDIDINQKGLLVPRMSTANRNAIVSPAHSLLIYNTTTDCFEAWNQSSLTWVALGCINCQLPGVFSASAATNLTTTSFDANWSTSAGATTYFLDIATDAAFTAFVAGYNNLNVGNVVTSSVTGLTCNTVYYYRVRANNACGTSSNSNTITLTTSTITANAGPDQNLTCGTSTTLAGNAPGTWSIVSGTGTITTPGSSTSTVTGLSGTVVLRWTTSCGTSFDDVTIVQCVTDDAFTVLKLHMDGANGSTTFTDNSPITPHTITAVGNVQISTAQSKFCQSGLFDGTGDVLTIPSNADFDFGSGDFTIDAWIYQTALPPVAGRLWANDATNIGGEIIFDTQPNGSIYAAFNNTSWSVGGGAPCIFSLNTWTHVALVRFGNNFSIYVNGVVCSTTINTGSLGNATTTRSIAGVTSGGPREFTGYIDEFRISKGIARWTGNFTPSESPYCD